MAENRMLTELVKVRAFHRYGAFQNIFIFRFVCMRYSFYENTCIFIIKLIKTIVRCQKY